MGMTIGCQFSLYPMTDRYIDVILDATADLKNEKNIWIESDDLSTMLIGPSEKIFDLVKSCFLKASRNAEHVVLNATFSRGCPGEPDELCCISENSTTAQDNKSVKKNNSKQLGINVAAQFALYPLNAQKYMDTIYREIEEAKKIVKVKPKHFCTRLDGDLTNVFTALERSFTNTGNDAAHVVMTITISKKE